MGPVIRCTFPFVGQNGDIPFSAKSSRKILTFWNYLGIYPYFETQFLENWVIAKLNLKKKIVELEFHLKIFKKLEFHTKTQFW